MSDALTAALESPANDLRDLFTDFYPGETIRRGRTRAVWRGGDGENVAVGAKVLTDFVTGETYGVWAFLTELVGLTSGDAAEHLLSRARLVSGRFSTPQARRTAAGRPEQRAAAEKRAEALQKRLQAEALTVQRTAPTTGASAYLERKGVSGLFTTHEVAPAVLPGGETVPGLVYSADAHGPFVQLVLTTLEGAVTGFQRLYDGDRGKRFVYGTRPAGAFVLLKPKGHLPKTAKSLGNLELGVCEGFATGASVCLARPRKVMFCALSAGNLAGVAKALRGRYGYTYRAKARRNDPYKTQYAVNVTIWGDLDESKTGQEKAHAAALASECYVRLPRFRSGYGDFNDLHQTRGLEAVRRSRKATPDATLAFAKELGKQKPSPDKHLAPLTLPGSGGALIVRAPQETGKTHQLAALLSGSGLRVLVVTHRESLAKNLAARLRFECYNEYPAPMLRSIPQLVICFDSLQKLTIGGELPRYDVLVLDESEQVLEHTTGRHIKRKAANFGVLEHYLREAPRIIAADANAGKLTVDTLKRFSPGRAITWHRHEHHVAAGRTVRLVSDRDDLLDTLEAEQRPAFYATDSKRHSRDLSAYLDDPRTLTINSETATTENAAAYLLDPTGQAPNWERVIASPSVQTGVSDDSGHWKHVLGSFTGYSSTPQDAVQALLRARRVETLTVYATRGRGAARTVQESLDGAAAVDDFEGAALERDGYGDRNPNYERLQAEVEAQRSRRQASYKPRLALELTRLGYALNLDVARTIGPDQLEARDERRAALKEAGRERYVSDRTCAERIDTATAERYGELYSLSQDKLFALEQFECRAFYRLPDSATDDELAELLRVDDYGALRKRVLHYEAFVEPGDVAEARARGELDKGVLRGDAAAHALRHEYGRRLGRVIGLDLETEAEAADKAARKAGLEAELAALRAEYPEAHPRRKGEINRLTAGLERRRDGIDAGTLTTRYRAADSSVKAFVAWCCEHYVALNHAGLVTATLANLKAKPLETIGDSLRRCELEHRHDGKRGAAKSYAVTTLSVSRMANYSRPRRENWSSARQTDEKTLDDGLSCKSAILASGTRVINDTKNADGMPYSEKPSPPPPRADAAPAGERPTLQRVPGYERLRAFVRVEAAGGTREALLDAFLKADSGDGAALSALSLYLQNPQVRAAIGLGA